MFTYFDLVMEFCSWLAKIGASFTVTMFCKKKDGYGFTSDGLFVGNRGCEAAFNELVEGFSILRGKKICGGRGDKLINWSSISWGGLQAMPEFKQFLAYKEAEEARFAEQRRFIELQRQARMTAREIERQDRVAALGYGKITETINNCTRPGYGGTIYYKYYIEHPENLQRNEDLCELREKARLLFEAFGHKGHYSTAWWDDGITSFKLSANVLEIIYEIAYTD